MGRSSRISVPSLLSWAILLVALGGLPWVLSVNSLFIAETVVVFALFALSTNLLVGFSGLVSFGQAVFFGMGAYTAAILWGTYHVSFWLGFFIAPLVAGLTAVVVGLVSLRTSKLYFSLLTLGFSQLAFEIANALYNLTGGSTGIFGINVPNYISGPVSNYEFVLTSVAVLTLVIYWIQTSSFGMVLKAIKQNPNRAQAVGIHVFRHHLLVFVISGSLCGLAGVLYVVYQQHVYPGLLQWTESGEPVLMSALGGISVFFGPALGALIYVVLEDWIGAFTTQWPLVVGILVLFLVLVYPEGLGGGIAQVINRMKQPLTHSKGGGSSS